MSPVTVVILLVSSIKLNATLELRTPIANDQNFEEGKVYSRGSTEVRALAIILYLSGLSFRGVSKLWASKHLRLLMVP